MTDDEYVACLVRVNSILTLFEKAQHQFDLAAAESACAGELLADLLREAHMDAARQKATHVSPKAIPVLDAGVQAFFQSQPWMRSNPDRVKALLVYADAVDRRRGVTSDYLTKAYKAARERRPQNWPDVLASLDHRGLVRFIGHDNGLKVWSLTERGWADVGGLMELPPRSVYEEAEAS